MSVKIINGDCRDILPTLTEQSVHCCVTSPPYFGLRDYGVDGQIGLEQTPEEFVSALIDVFREVRRVLRDDGTLWVNLGDSYNANGRKGNGHEKMTPGGCKQMTNRGSAANADHCRPSCAKLKPKDLIGIPWRVAFALQTDGWYLRSDIIWSKPNPMPESVTDRPTKAHEYIFLLSKSEKYFYDHQAIKEPAAPASLVRWGQDAEAQSGSDRVPGKTNGNMKAVGGARSKRDSFRREDSKRAEVIPCQTVGTHRPDRAESEYDINTRNRRSVWTVPTIPYSGAHFATFPPKLITPCILAGCPEGGTVLDPFGGSGTTGMVAAQNRRNAILIELNPNYVELQQQRTRNVQIRAF